MSIYQNIDSKDEMSMSSYLETVPQNLRMG